MQKKQGGFGAFVANESEQTRLRADRAEAARAEASGAATPGQPKSGAVSATRLADGAAAPTAAVIPK
jgi:hypothetical protein